MQLCRVLWQQQTVLKVNLFMTKNQPGTSGKETCRSLKCLAGKCKTRSGGRQKANALRAQRWRGTMAPGWGLDQPGPRVALKSMAFTPTSKWQLLKEGDMIRLFMNSSPELNCREQMRCREASQNESYCWGPCENKSESILTSAAAALEFLALKVHQLAFGGIKYLKETSRKHSRENTSSIQKVGEVDFSRGKSITHPENTSATIQSCPQSSVSLSLGELSPRTHPLHSYSPPLEFTPFCLQ